MSLGFVLLANFGLEREPIIRRPFVASRSHTVLLYGRQYTCRLLVRGRRRIGVDFAWLRRREG